MDLNGKPLTAKRIYIFLISLSIIVGIPLIYPQGPGIIQAGVFGLGIGIFKIAWDVDFLKKNKWDKIINAVFWLIVMVVW